MAHRQRVRVVQTGFKYPILRLEEEVWTEAGTGIEQVRLLSSVADH